MPRVFTFFRVVMTSFLCHLFSYWFVHSIVRSSAIHHTRVMNAKGNFREKIS